MIKNKTSLLKNKNYLQKIDYNFSRLGSEFDMKLSVRVTPNNMFCTLMDLKTKKILQSGSSGMYNIQSSKKTLAFSTKLILSHFLQDIKSYIANQSIHISLISPSRVRKKILQQIFLHFKFTSSSILLEVDPVKCFNGCRPKKKRRKKRKGFRIFK